MHALKRVLEFRVQDGRGTVKRMEEGGGAEEAVGRDGS